MKKLLIAAALFLNACGTQPAQDPNAQKDANQKGGEIDRQPAEKKVVTEYKKNGTNYAFAVADSKDLPECSLNNTKQIAYVKNEDMFYSCEKDVWESVPIKGKDGTQGSTGPVGPTGPQGAKGEPATPIPPNQWFDPITGKYWLIGGAANYFATATFTQACKNGWRLPLRSEGLDAGNHGIGSASALISGPTDMWTSELVANFETTHAYTIRVSPNVQEIAKLQTESHGIMCIQN